MSRKPAQLGDDCSSRVGLRGDSERVLQKLVRTFFDEQADDPVRIEDEVAASGLLVADRGEQAGELACPREGARVRREVGRAGRHGRREGSHASAIKGHRLKHGQMEGKSNEREIGSSDGGFGDGRRAGGRIEAPRARRSFSDGEIRRRRGHTISRSAAGYRGSRYALRLRGRAHPLSCGSPASRPLPDLLT